MIPNPAADVIIGDAQPLFKCKQFFLETNNFIYIYVKGNFTKREKLFMETKITDEVKPEHKFHHVPTINRERAPCERGCGRGISPRGCSWRKIFSFDYYLGDV